MIKVLRSSTGGTSFCRIDQQDADDQKRTKE
jgi:hypothetical protein